jgi:hypothetical protein
MNMDVKVCGDCNLEKSLENFTYRKDTERYESRCCDCTKEYNRKYYLKNKEKLINNSNLYYRENVEKALMQGKKYREDNIEIIKKRKSDYHIKNVEKIREKTKNWRKENKEKRNQSERERRKNDTLHKLVHYLRVRTNFYIKKMNITKSNSSLKIIGCSPLFLKEYIENQFIQDMSWEKFGKYIHIDHIIPLSSAKTEEELFKLCHYTNLQPLWAEDNLKKSNKITELIN